MELKVNLKSLLTDLKHLDKLVNKSARKRIPHPTLSVVSLGDNGLLLTCGDVQRFMPSEIIKMGGFACEIKRLVAVLETFKGGDLAVSASDTKLQLEVGGSCFRMPIQEYSEGFANLKREKKSSSIYARWSLSRARA